MTLREVNSVIFDTECGTLLLDGHSCSQPILSMGAKGLIDNFFIYSFNEQTSIVSPPKCVFGIYADMGEVAYIDRSPKTEAGAQRNCLEGDDSSLYGLFERYEELYSALRKIAFRDRDAQWSPLVQEYCELLQKISGPVIWSFYNQLFPAFFQWAEELRSAR